MRRAGLRTSRLLTTYEKHPIPSQFRSLRRACRSSLRYLDRYAGNASGSDDPAAQWTASPVHLGLASYTFRNFDRAQLIGFMKQLNVLALNAKDVKDHLPMDPTEEAKALDDYHAAGIQLHAAGTIYFDKDEDADIRSKFEYCKRAGISVIVAGDPAPRYSSAHREVCQGVRHALRHPQSRAGG